MIKYIRLLYYSFYRPKIFFPKKTYSLFKEDLFIQKYFKDKNKGFYIDVGSYHPLEGNNTQILYKKGWNGMNFDINEYSIEIFNFLRKRDINIKSGISNKKTRIKMFYRKKINMLNTVNKNFARKNFKNGFKEKLVNVNTLNYFMEKNFKKSKKIDFLNIDVEGDEIKVLKSLNFKKYTPNLICIEIHDKFYKKSKVYRFLINKRYKIAWNIKYSFVFKKI